MIARLIAGMVALAVTPASAAPVVKVAGVDAEAMPDLRDRIMSLLLSAGIPLSTTRNGRDMPAPAFVVSVRVQPQGATASVASAAGYCVGGTRLAAAADLRMRDAASQAVVWGDSVTGSVSIGRDIVAGRGVGVGDCGSAAPWTADYGRLTDALAQAIVRQIAFRLDPLRVVAVDGRTLVLNHGGALVPLGAMVQVASVTGAPVLYRVSASTPASATAVPHGTAAAVAPGAIARILEEDDPAASARRYEKVDLP